MENGARVIKGFILSIPESVSRLWHGAGQLESQQLPPPTMNQEEDLVDNSHDEQSVSLLHLSFLAFHILSTPPSFRGHPKCWVKLQFSWQPNISIPFPPGVKWATWIIYAISLFVIAICNFCY
ncbi:hypothetical protein NC652_037496 [Populus alba x Populus x berolinensis]|nr:hypothetical protein NC652_037496 [Populus alba x Populus x berolinensis]